MFSTRYHKQFFFAILLRNISSFEYIKSNNLLFIIRSIFLSDNKLHQRTSGTSHFIILCVYFPKQWQLVPQSFLGTLSLMQASGSTAHCFIRCEFSTYVSESFMQNDDSKLYELSSEHYFGASFLHTGVLPVWGDNLTLVSCNQQNIY